MMDNPFLILIIAAAGIVLSKELPVKVDVSLTPPVVETPSVSTEEQDVSNENIILIAHVDTVNGPLPDFYKLMEGTQIIQMYNREDCLAEKDIIRVQLMQQLLLQGTSFTDVKTFCFNKEEFYKHVEEEHTPKKPMGFNVQIGYKDAIKT